MLLHALLSFWSRICIFSSASACEEFVQNRLHSFMSVLPNVLDSRSHDAELDEKGWGSTCKAVVVVNSEGIWCYFLQCCMSDRYKFRKYCPSFLRTALSSSPFPSCAPSPLSGDSVGSLGWRSSPSVVPTGFSWQFRFVTLDLEEIWCVHLCHGLLRLVDVHIPLPRVERSGVRCLPSFHCLHRGGRLHAFMHLIPIDLVSSW
ncbi:hypothetical protein PAXRUDRAFT_283731 [Paxillus rubicundulus Ve08.2h10]|uniref:Secreted protein n=1 Tax=Paxillus rubicundulus Ve08.2h10 TaxID=930991 RepID=A0A0D0DG07_9AGAM|nr:hypothetical protein PAXRUDRAFT_283731 [Paxillus rubicundulus Ve08.2h10]